MQSWFNIKKQISVIQHINKKKTMIISIDSVKVFEKNPHTLVIKRNKKLGIEENLLNLIQSIHKSLQVIGLIELFSLKIKEGNSRIRISALLTSIQHCTAESSQSN